MVIRHTLSLFALGLLGACASNAGSQDPGSESVESVDQADTDRGGDGSDRDRDDREGRRTHVRHVVLVSVDGLHELDLATFIASHPASTLARLADPGVQYTNAHAPTPTDPFPWLVALVTGGTPKTTGVYYDDSFDRTLFPPGSDC